VLRSITGKAGAAPTRTLPAGAADTLAFVANRSLYTSYVRLIPTLTLEMDAVADDTTLSSIPDLPSNVSKTLVLLYNNSSGAGPAAELSFRADGTGLFKRDGQRSRGTWNAADMTLTLSTPEITSNVIQAPNLSYIEVEYSTTQVKLRRFSGTDKRGFISLTTSGYATFAQGERPNGPFVRTDIWAVEDWSNAVAPTDLSGVTLAGLPDDPLIRFLPNNQMTVSLNAGGSAQVAQFPNVVANWRVFDSRLVLDLSHYVSNPGFEPTATTLNMGRVRLDADGSERWLVRGSRDDDYDTYEAIVVRPQQNLAFNDTSAVAVFTSSFNLNYIGRRTVYTARADHTSSVETLAVDGVTRQLTASTSWVIESGKLVMRSFRQPGSNVSMATCPAGVTCTVYSERIWTMLGSDAKSVTVLEAYKTSPNSTARNTVQRLALN
jgi:hypothetical protein